MTTKLYLLSSKEPIGWDQSDSFVVRAKSEEEARLLASGSAGAEGKERWLNPSRSSCEILSSEGASGIIIDSFNAG
jgi:hypothetical protein